MDQVTLAALDANKHVFTPTRDDHTQYARADGTRAFTGGVTVNSGGLTVTAGGLIVASGNTSLQTLSSGAITSSGEVKGTDFNATGLTGATTASRYVGATAAGPPASGTFAVGDFIITADAAIWICIVAGSPGTWRMPRASVSGQNQVFLATLGASTAAGFTADAVVPLDQVTISQGPNQTTSAASVFSWNSTTHILTILQGGIFLVSYQVYYQIGTAVTAPARFLAAVKVNSTTVIIQAEQATFGNGNFATPGGAVPWSFSTNDTVQLRAIQLTGAGQAIFGSGAGGQALTYLGLTRVG